jgi:hypothetical protein
MEKAFAGIYFNTTINYFNYSTEVVKERESEEKNSKASAEASLTGYQTVISILVAVGTFLLTIKQDNTPKKKEFLKKSLIVIMIPGIALISVGVLISIHFSFLYQIPIFLILLIPSLIIIYLAFEK